MSWRKEQRRAERGYHHGNLKEALLQAALGLIAEKGAAGFTFADAARMAGVSPAAPYRHFRDRDELLSSIAQRGFEQFEALPMSAEDLLEAEVLIYLRGLGFPTDRRPQAAKEAADQNQSGPPPVPPGGPWGTPK